MKKKYFAFLITFILLLTSAIPVFAETSNLEDDSQYDIAMINESVAERYYIIDDADLLSDDEELSINEQLYSISNNQQFDVIAVTTDTLDGKTPMEYADDYYDYNGYGQGENKDGCLLLISMEDRDWYISTTGYGITALTDAGIEFIGDEIVYYLGDDDYYNGISTYASLVDEFVTQAKTGSAYDNGNMPKREKKFQITYLLGGIVCGLVLALLLLSFFKNQLKSVAKKAQADDYLVQGSLVITRESDDFITANITKTARESESKGSSTHSGSSGTSHGGGGGKF